MSTRRSGPRVTFTSRDVRAGCFCCHGTAARHHDATGHPTWADVVLSVRYGREEADSRQLDIEAAIAARAP